MDFDLISTIANVITALAAASAFLTWHHDKKIEKYRIGIDIIHNTLGDDDVITFIHMIDYDEQWFSKNFHNTELEKKVDKALSCYSYLIDLKNANIINKQTFNSAKYVIKRILKNNQAQAYLFNLHHYCKKIGTDCPFESLIKFGKDKQILDSSFFNPTIGISKYPKTLNW